jgi:aspartate aminotransferase-like enzyme
MKYRLLAPGPTAVPDRVLKEMSKEMIHHRTDRFEQIFSECKSGLCWLLNTKTPPLILTASATGAFEGAIQNFFNIGDKVLCVTGGKFADNWLKMSQNFQLNAIEIPVEWGKAVKAEQVSDALKKHPDTKGVIIVASETSTGVRHPYEEIAQLVKNKDCLVVVDAVTAVGIWDVCLKDIDILITGSQKGLMLPPGLSFLWASEKALSKKSTAPKFYFDLNKEQKAQSKNQTGHTPAVSLIIALKEALLMMKEEGRENIFARHKRLAMATREAMKALDLKLFSESPSDSITAIYTPKGVKDNAIYDALMSMANYNIAGGQEQLAGKIFRIGHMGYVDEIDLIGLLGALEIVLKKLGVKLEAGLAFKAAEPILREGFLLNS